MPFVVGLLQTTLTMTDCTHRLASDPSGSTFPLCVEISSGLIRQSNDYVPVEEHVPGCPHLCSIWREIEPRRQHIEDGETRPLHGAPFGLISGAVIISQSIYDFLIGDPNIILFVFSC